MNAIPLPRNFGLTAGKTSVVAYVEDAESRAVVESVFAAHEWSNDNVHEGGLAEAVAAMSAGETAGLMLIDMTSSPDPLGEARTMAPMCPPGTSIIAIGAVNDVHLYRDLRDCGIRDYLVKPFSAEELTGAIDGACQTETQEREPVQKRVVFVIGSRGGVGASTVATNAAWLLAHEHGQRTALLDLDLHFGTCALSLDLLPGRGLREVLENPERLDALFVASAMVQESENLFILGSEEPLDDEVYFGSQSLDLLIASLRESFDAIVVDVPRDCLVSHREQLAAAQHIVLVSDMTLAGARDTMRLMSMLKDAAPQAEVHITANQIGRAKHDGLPQNEFEKGIERKVQFALPFDAKALGLANNAGKAVAAVAKTSKVGVGLEQLAAAISGVEAKPQRKARFALPLKRKAG
jgi:pilus assembly protein CpaE